MPFGVSLLNQQILTPIDFIYGFLKGENYGKP